jgi:CBS domain-containing protein
VRINLFGSAKTAFTPVASVVSRHFPSSCLAEDLAADSHLPGELSAVLELKQRHRPQGPVAGLETPFADEFFFTPPAQATVQQACASGKGALEGSVLGPDPVAEKHCKDVRGKRSRETPVREIMSSDLTIVTPREPVENCLRMMTEKRIRHLPVVDGDKLRGIISIRDPVETSSSRETAAEVWRVWNAGRESNLKHVLCGGVQPGPS